MLELHVTTRDTKVKPAMVRKEGNIPAVVYGRTCENTPIAVSQSDFTHVYKEAGESTVVTLATDEGKKVSVLVHEVVADPVSGEPMHVDFYAVEADKEVEVNVPLTFEGVAPAEKNLGGVVVKVMHEVTVKGLPKDLPHEVTVDLGLLETLESHITLSQLPLPTGVAAVGEDDDVVASISTATEEEDETATFDASAVEVEKKGKKEEEMEE